jgi:hypothetical protein
MFRGKTYHHRSGWDLKLKTRVWTFSPQIDEFGGRSAYYFNAAPIFCALWSPDLDLCVLLCLSEAIPVLPHNWRPCPIYYWKVPLSSNKNTRRSPWDKPPCPSCTSARPSDDYSLWTKRSKLPTSSLDRCWRWSIDLAFLQPSFVSKLALPMSFRQFMFSSWTTCAFFGESQGIRYAAQVTNKYLPLLEDCRIDHNRGIVSVSSCSIHDFASQLGGEIVIVSNA